jgi:hypothetical protein
VDYYSKGVFLAFLTINKINSMILFGNMMLGIAALVYSVLLFSLYSRPAPGGDANVGTPSTPLRILLQMIFAS